MTPRRSSFCCKPPACVATRWGCAATGVWYPGWSQYFLNDAPMSRRPWLHRIQCVGRPCSALRAVSCAVLRHGSGWAARTQDRRRWFAGRCCWCGRLGRPTAPAALVGRTVPHAASRAVRLVRPGRRLRHAARCVLHRYQAIDALLFKHAEHTRFADRRHPEARRAESIPLPKWADPTRFPLRRGSR